MVIQKDGKSAHNSDPWPNNVIFFCILTNAYNMLLYYCIVLYFWMMIKWSIKRWRKSLRRAWTRCSVLERRRRSMRLDWTVRYVCILCVVYVIYMLCVYITCSRLHVHVYLCLYFLYCIMPYYVYAYIDMCYTTS